jgi:hypothetical protein
VAHPDDQPISIPELHTHDHLLDYIEHYAGPDARFQKLRDLALECRAGTELRRADG